MVITESVLNDKKKKQKPCKFILIIWDIIKQQVGLLLVNDVMQWDG